MILNTFPLKVETKSFTIPDKLSSRQLINYQVQFTSICPNCNNNQLLSSLQSSTQFFESISCSCNLIFHLHSANILELPARITMLSIELSQNIEAELRINEDIVVIYNYQNEETSASKIHFPNLQRLIQNNSLPSLISKLNNLIPFS